MSRAQELLAAAKARREAMAKAATPTPTPTPAPVAPTTTPGQVARLAQLRAAVAAKRAAAPDAPAIQLPAPAPAPTLEQAREKVAAATTTTTSAMDRARAKVAELRLKAQTLRAGGQVSVELPVHALEVLGVPATPAIPTKQAVAEGMIDKGSVTLELLNEEQRLAVRLATEGKPFVLVGSAGSGKTTTVKLAVESMHAAGIISSIPAGRNTKNLSSGAPAIAVVSYTNQAVTNIRTAMVEVYRGHCLTIHKVLEYSPEYYEVLNDDGSIRKTMRYVPLRTAADPIPYLDMIIIEEAGSVPLDLHDQLMAALPAGIPTIYLGDLNQLPPVFGDAILGYKLLELPVVALQRTYRQSGDSPIKKLAYTILDGRPLSDDQLKRMEVPGQLEFRPFKSKVEDPELACKITGKHLSSLVDSHFQHLEAGTTPVDPLDTFNYQEDVILCPYGKGFGSFELAKHIAQAVSTHLGSPTWEIIAGFQKVYYAVGDIVYFAKAKWEITDISANPNYLGQSPQFPSLALDRWGVNHDMKAAGELKAAQHEMDLDKFFASVANMSLRDKAEVATRSASHVIRLRHIDGERPPAELKSVGDIAGIALAYALTVHKSQGSEWPKVFFVAHHTHSTMFQREVIYTACTRARTGLRIYYAGDEKLKPGASVFNRGIVNQKIPGNTLEAKLEYFRSKLIAAATKVEVELAREYGRAPDLGRVFSKTDAQLAQEMLAALRAARAQGDGSLAGSDDYDVED